MIENRVSTLLGTKRATIRDLSNDAGLAYGTAHALYHGTTTRVDFDVLNKLCRYFGCGVGDLLIYRPDETPAQDEHSGQPAAEQPS